MLQATRGCASTLTVQEAISCLQGDAQGHSQDWSGGGGGPKVANVSTGVMPPGIFKCPCNYVIARVVRVVSGQPKTPLNTPLMLSGMTSPGKAL